MPDSLDSPATEYWELDSCLDALLKNLSLNQMVCNATERALGQISRMFYSNVSNWHPDLRSVLTERIRGVAQAYSLTLANLDFASKQNPGETKEEVHGIDGNGVGE